MIESIISWRIREKRVEKRKEKRVEKLSADLVGKEPTTLAGREPSTFADSAEDPIVGLNREKRVERRKWKVDFIKFS